MDRQEALDAIKVLNQEINGIGNTINFLEGLIKEPMTEGERIKVDARLDEAVVELQTKLKERCELRKLAPLTVSEALTRMRDINSELEELRQRMGALTFESGQLRGFLEIELSEFGGELRRQSKKQ